MGQGIIRYVKVINRTVEGKFLLCERYGWFTVERFNIYYSRQDDCYYTSKHNKVKEMIINKMKVSLYPIGVDLSASKLLKTVKVSLGMSVFVKGLHPKTKTMYMERGIVDVYKNEFVVEFEKIPGLSGSAILNEYGQLIYVYGLIRKHINKTRVLIYVGDIVKDVILKDKEEEIDLEEIKYQIDNHKVDNRVFNMIIDAKTNFGKTKFINQKVAATYSVGTKFLIVLTSYQQMIETVYWIKHDYEIYGVDADDISILSFKEDSSHDTTKRVLICHMETFFYWVVSLRYQERVIVIDEWDIITNVVNEVRSKFNNKFILITASRDKVDLDTIRVNKMKSNIEIHGSKSFDPNLFHGIEKGLIFVPSESFANELKIKYNLDWEFRNTIVEEHGIFFCGENLRRGMNWNPYVIYDFGFNTRISVKNMKLKWVREQITLSDLDQTSGRLNRALKNGYGIYYCALDLKKIEWKNGRDFDKFYSINVIRCINNGFVNLSLFKGKYDKETVYLMTDDRFLVDDKLGLTEFKSGSIGKVVFQFDGVASIYINGNLERTVINNMYRYYNRKGKGFGFFLSIWRYCFLDKLFYGDVTYVIAGNEIAKMV